MARNLEELKYQNVRISDELKVRVLFEITKRMNGEHDGVLHEPLDQIIINQYTIIKLNEEVRSRNK